MVWLVTVALLNDEQWIAIKVIAMPTKQDLSLYEDTK